MKRKTLSSKLIIEKVTFFILILFLLLFCIERSPELLLIIIPLFICIDYLIYYLPCKIAYDDERVYIKKKKGELIIALSDIYTIKKTGLGLGNVNVWKIQYTNYKGSGSARFYPRYYTTGIEDFTKQVKLKNPKVEIKEFSWSLKSA